MAVSQEHIVAVSNLGLSKSNRSWKLHTLYT
jgi:hypothetical protein